MKKLLAVLILVSAIAANACVTQKIRQKEIRKGSADLIWRVDQYGREYFTIRVPAGEWQLVCIRYGEEFTVRTYSGGEYISQFRDAEFPFDFKLVRK